MADAERGIDSDLSACIAKSEVCPNSRWKLELEKGTARLSLRDPPAWVDERCKEGRLIPMSFTLE